MMVLKVFFEPLTKCLNLFCYVLFMTVKTFAFIPIYYPTFCCVWNGTRNRLDLEMQAEPHRSKHLAHNYAERLELKWEGR